MSTTTDSGTRIDLRKGRRLIGGRTSEETSEQVELLELQECRGLVVFSSDFRDQTEIETWDFCLEWRKKITELQHQGLPVDL